MSEKDWKIESLLKTLQMEQLKNVGFVLAREELKTESKELSRHNISAFVESDEHRTYMIDTLQKHVSSDGVQEFADGMSSQDN